MPTLPLGIRLLELAAGLTDVAAHWFLQSTLVIAAGLVAGRLLRRRGAAVQSVVYRTTLAVALVCPLVTGLLSRAGVSLALLRLPEIRVAQVEQLPAASRVDVTAKNSSTRDVATTGVVNRVRADIGADQAVHSSFHDRSGGQFPDSRQFSAGPDASGFPLSTQSWPKNGDHADISEPTATLTTPAWVIRPIAATGAVVVSLVWLGGSAMLLARLILDYLGLIRTRRTAVAAGVEERLLCRTLALQMEVRAPELLRTPLVAGPCLAGIIFPAVLLPEELPSVTLATVLVHELAHLRRGDCLWNLWRQTTVAVLFFQPLAWRLSRRLEAAAEEVCDDHAVQFGADRRSYADMLVSLAERTMLPSSSVVVPLVTLRSLLARRVTRVLDGSRRLSLTASLAALCFIVGAGLGVTVLTGLLGSGGNSVAAAPSDASSGNGSVKAGENSDKTIVTPASNDPAQNDATASGNEAKSKHISGTVLSAEGKPAAGANVVLIGRRRESIRAIDFSTEHPEVLAQAQCDGAGNFKMSVADFSSARFLSAQLLARLPDSGVAWKAVNTDEPASKFTIKLPESSAARGRLITLEGQPAKAVQVKVVSIHLQRVSYSDPDNSVDSMSGPMPAEVWPLKVVTGDDGWFTVSGVPVNASLGLQVDQEPFAPEWWVWDAKDESTHVKPLSPAQIITGVVVAPDTGQPIANALIHANQGWEQGMHGMQGVVGKTDARGRFRVNPYGAKSYDVTAFAPPGAPYLGQEIHYQWSDTEREHALRFELPRGVMVSGTITEQPGGKPVAKATVRYTALQNNPHAKDIPLEGIYQPTELSDVKGHYTIAVPAGAGHLTVKSSTGEHVLEELDGNLISEGRPGGQRLYVNAHAPLDLPDNAREQTQDFALQRGEAIHGEIMSVDDGIPKRLVVIHRAVLTSFSDGFFAHEPITLPDNKFEIRGVPRDGEFPVYLLDPVAKQGKLLMARGSDAGRSLQVKLEPCGSLTMRFVDVDGKPVRGHVPSLMIVFTPGANLFAALAGLGKSQADETFVQNFDRLNCWDMMSDENGRLVVPTLIPGVTYRLIKDGGMGRPMLDREFTVKPEERLELPDIVLGDDAVRRAEEKWMERKKKNVSDAAALIGSSDSQSKMKGADKSSGEKMPEPKAAENKNNSAAMQGPFAPSTSVKERQDNLLQIYGQVIGPDEKPVAGAKLFVLSWVGALPVGQRGVKAWAVSDSKGQFDFAIRRTDLGLQAPDDWLDYSLVATADGYGMAIGTLGDFDTSGNAAKLLAIWPGEVELQAKRLQGKKPVLRLVHDDAPLTGRLVSLEGQPIVGAKVALRELWGSEQGNLDDWEKAAREPKADYFTLQRQTTQCIYGPEMPLVVPVATTDQNGRFTLPGIGRQRVVQLMVSGPGVETMPIWARTRAGEKITVPYEWQQRGDLENETYYPNNFTHVTGPSNAVVGTVTDLESDKPLAGVTVLSQKVHGNPTQGYGQDYIRTVTDAEGHYRLEGMPLGDGNEIGTFTLDKPYLPNSKSVKIDVGQQPIKLDFKLPRGVWVEGRVTDRDTGKPMTGSISYFGFLDNPALKKIGSFDVDLRWYQRTGSDGSFRVAALPGRGIVAVSIDNYEGYRRGAGAEKIAGGDTKSGALLFHTEPQLCVAIEFQLLAEINPADTGDTVSLDLKVSQGRTVTGNVVDPDGRPVSEVLFNGVEPDFLIWDHLGSSTFTIHSYDPAKPRRLVFYAPKENLAAIYMLQGQPPEKLVVKLQPAGSVHGRLVDEHVSPLSNIGLDAADSDAMPIPQPDPDHLYLGPTTDEEGRFEIHGLVPGQDYRFEARDPGRHLILGYLPEAVTVAAGENKDLGDITLEKVNIPQGRPSKKQKDQENGKDKDRAKDKDAPGGTGSARGSAKIHENTGQANGTPMESTDKANGNLANPKASPADDSLTVRGKVVDPDGKPVAGAEVMAVRWFWNYEGDRGPLAVAKTDEIGRFAISYRKSQFTIEVDHPEQWKDAVIAALAPNSPYGPSDLLQRHQAGGRADIATRAG
jgi:beta-lactamase regulating signal transducer with metallopeptidase domain/protocatechuate 3,4-dioxygenase beta subunit